MYLATILALVLLAVTPILSLPTNTDPIIIARDVEEDSSPAPLTLNQLLKRATPVGVTCGTGNTKNEYTTAEVSKAYNAGKSLLKQGKLVGKYPEYYGASDQSVRTALPKECITQNGFGIVSKLYSWPILPGGNTYTGGDPKSDRVVMIKIDSTAGGLPVTQILYCLTMTHLGASSSTFRPCPANGK